MKLPRAADADSLEVKMTPMIDVVFLLLIFFVWTSSFQTPEFDLPSSLAEAPQGGSTENQSANPPVEAFDEIVVRLFLQDVTTVIELNGNTVADAAALRTQLAEIIALGVQPPIIIDPADRVTMDRAIEAYDAARDAGADRVLFAAHP
ncbi:ExbD/TolR family protein [Planctomycetes bacterium K23_9]|uniref:Biopolymer transport protein ExbD/TolR n=1 Tax=Stieleria marina TaxID=1930275 RepID=A0A517P317_9BACT|nr:Biopolymer transport protein ExbD/TolR [Planctomycetes bacterium K23_9]